MKDTFAGKTSVPQVELTVCSELRQGGPWWVVGDGTCLPLWEPGHSLRDGGFAEGREREEKEAL